MYWIKVHMYFFLAEKCVSTGVGSELLVRPWSWGTCSSLGCLGETVVVAWGRHTHTSHDSPPCVLDSPSLNRSFRTCSSFMVRYMWYVYFRNSKNNSQYNKNNLHLKYIIFLCGNYINNNYHRFHYLQEILMYMCLFVLLAFILKIHQDSGVKILCCNFKFDEKFCRRIRFQLST